MGKVAKAITAAVLAAIGAATTALADGEITWAEGGVIVGAAVVAGYGVWRVPNTPQAR